MPTLSFLPTKGFQKVRCTAVMEMEEINATINCRTVTQQIEEGTPWVAAISANMDIGSKEPIVTDLTLKQVTTGQIQQAQREDPIISKVTLYNKRAGVIHCPAIWENGITFATSQMEFCCRRPGIELNKAYPQI